MVGARRAAAHGFTLPELMAAVAIVAVLSALAAPSFSQLVASQRIKGVASDLFSALTRARSEAIKRNIEVTLLPATAGRWADGWSIPNPADTGNKIDDHGPVPTITVDGPLSVVYLANGRLKNGAEPSFQISAAQAPHVRCVRVDLSGRPFQKSSAC